MTETLYRTDPYLKQAEARVAAITPEGGVVLDRTIFYPTGGGQPGDAGVLTWGSREIAIATTAKGEAGAVVLIPGEAAALPEPGERVLQSLDWDRRYRHMRVHTALHLLSVVIPLPVTGGAIATDKGRLDFDMPESPQTKEALEAALNDLVDADLAVTEDWITEAVLDANPSLVKTMSVAPPRGQGPVRLIRIGSGETQVDLQPCGGTHVARTGEIGRLRLGKIEKKGALNRRVNLHLED
jgi:misacylated tRNA(Ala) deacylase